MKQISKSAVIGVILLLLVNCIYSQNRQTLDGGLGKYIKYKREAKALIISTENAIIEILPYSNQVIRIRVSMTKTFKDDFSYALISDVNKFNWTIEDNRNSIWVHTDSLDLEISKRSLLFNYFNKKGVKILANDSFGHYYSGNELTCYNTLSLSERFIGLGEKTGNLDRRGQGYTNWNTDCFGYTNETDPLYSSIPFYIGIHDSIIYGIFLDQSTKSNFNFGASNNRFSSFSVEASEIRYFFIYSDKVSNIIKNYTWLTGRIPMPPKWSLGYHQSRWSYFPDTKILNLAESFIQKDIPLDVIHLDIHYMDDYKIFTWNKNKFPDPLNMINKLKKIGVNTTVIIDPGIKIDTTYETFKTGELQDIYLKYPDGTPYRGSVWPGLCQFPDFTMSKTRSWWGKSFKTYTDIGVAGFWNDMNEPATWGQRFPPLVKFNFEGNPEYTINGRNIYGMQMARATYEGTKQLLINQRPFVLTRAGFSGIQRYSAIWTGDNTATEDHLLLGVRLVNSLGLSGVAFCGTDVGGFAGETTNSLYSRWITIGAFTPFFRGHKMINMKESEPWSYGEETEEIARNYIKLRYKLIPYIYSCFHESTLNGLPVARSLAITTPFDPIIYSSDYQNQFLFGPSMLITPSKSSENYTKVYFPNGKWYNFYSGEIIDGNNYKVIPSPIFKLPVFVKASAIIPSQKALQSLSIGKIDTLDIHFYNGNQKNDFVLYEDDGTSFDFDNGQYYERDIKFNPGDKTISLAKVKGNYTPSYKIFRIILHHFNSGNNYFINNKQVFKDRIEFSWLDSYHHLYYAPNEKEEVDVIFINNINEEIKISWK